eukprot:SAG22_NODE_142_length_17922_cov_10.990406_13_plen_290_part_00
MLYGRKCTCLSDLTYHWQAPGSHFEAMAPFAPRFAPCFPLLLALAGLPALARAAGPSRPQLQCGHDWLTAPDDSAARAVLLTGPAASALHGEADDGSPGGTLTLSNGLIERSFVTSPSFGTVDLRDLKTGDSALRHIVPEAELTIGGVRYTLGGLYLADEPSPTGAQFQGQHAFLNRTGLAARLRVRPNAWTYASHRVSAPEPDLPWVPGRRNSPTYVSWPPRGQRLSVRFAPPKGSPAALRGLNITLVYELYDVRTKALLSFCCASTVFRYLRRCLSVRSRSTRGRPC